MDGLSSGQLTVIIIYAMVCKKIKFFFVPYSIDNKYFRDRALAAIPKRAKLREKLFLEPNRQVILYAAKLLKRKRPNDLIEAFSRLLKNKTNQGSLSRFSW